MKKFIDLATVAVLVIAATTLVSHGDVRQEMGEFLKTVLHKLAPWLNTAIYS